ncbi:MAG: hypothetical protein AB7G75_13760 [Candidatus Binatia bacterium]
MQWLIPVAMGLWAIWSWSQEQERMRRIERARLAALYVNPFLSACEDLQSRIYHILELDGLPTLQQRYPDGSYAEETLYLIARYFGWAVVLQRYSPYAHDPKVVRLAEAVRDAFATADAEFLVGPFNFFHPEQKALGKIVMNRFEGQHGFEFDTISSYEFRVRLMSPPLSESQSVQQSLEALRTAKEPGSLQSWQRLGKAQHHLVDLLRYLEAKEGYRLFAGERKKCFEQEEQEALQEARLVPRPDPATA